MSDVAEGVVGRGSCPRTLAAALQRTVGKKKTKQSLFNEEMERVRQWADRQIAMGHDLSADDLVEELRLVIESTEFELQEAMDNRGGLLAKNEVKRLQACADRLANLDSYSGHKYAKAKICHWCEFTEHNPSNVVPFSKEENDIVCLLS